MLPQDRFPGTTEERLRARTRELRLQAIHAQLSAASTLCLVAKNEITYGDFRQARMAIESVRQAMESVRGHIAEPNHVPPDSLPPIRHELGRLERYLAETEAGLTGT